MLTRRQLGALALLTLMWGLNWPMMKFSLRELSPLYFRAVTMTGGALLLLAFYRGRGVRFALPPGEFVRIAWLDYGFAQIIWFGMARNLPPAASAFSIMAVPLIGTGSATLIVGEVPQWQDLAAAVLIVVAIASALLPRRMSVR